MTRASLVLSALLTLALLSGPRSQVVTKDRSSPAGSAAQETDGRAGKERLWTESVEAMQKLDTYGFVCKRRLLSSQPGFTGRGLRFDGDGSYVRTNGCVERGVLYHRYGAHSFLQHGRRFLAGIEDGDFRMTAQVASDGSSPPRLLDPEILFTLLANRDDQIIRERVTTIGVTPSKLLTVQLDSDSCHALVTAGVLADPHGLRATHSLWATSRNYRSRRPPAPLEGHLTLFIDPASRRVLRMRAHVYLVVPESQNLGMAMAGGPQPGLKVDPRVTALDDIPEGEVRWKDGLPERRFKDNERRAEIDVIFENFETVKIPDLDEQTKRLLGWN